MSRLVHPLKALRTPLLWSLLLHALPAIWLAGPNLLPTWVPPIPIEVLPAVSHPPSPSPAKVLPPPSPRHRTLDKRGAKTESRTTIPTQPSDLRSISFSSANVMVFLAVKKIGQSPHRDLAALLLSMLPDHRTLIAESGVDLFSTFDALLIATAHPREVRATFLAASYSDEASIAPLLGRKLPNWDGRTFSTIAPHLSVLAPPEVAAELKRAEAQPNQDTARGELAWVQALKQLRTLSQTKGSPEVSASIADIPALFRFGDGYPTPLDAALAIALGEGLGVRLRANFRDEEEATRFAERWPAALARYQASTRLLGLSSALDNLHLHRQGKTLELSGTLSAAHLRIAQTLLEAGLKTRSQSKQAKPTLPE